MDPLLQEMLDESMILTKRLLLLIVSDQDDMKDCINGEVLDAYIRASQEAMDIAEKIQNSLMMLQAGQKSVL